MTSQYSNRSMAALGWGGGSDGGGGRGWTEPRTTTWIEMSFEIPSTKLEMHQSWYL